MKRLITRLACALLLLAPFAAPAQVLWQLKSPSGETSWLLGTMHSEDPRLLEFKDPLMSAMKQSRVFAMELVPDSRTLEALSEAMVLPEGESLEDILGADLYAEVVRILKDYGMGEPAVRRMQPWAAAMTLSLPPPETGLFMDLALSFRARGLGLEVRGLETLEEQLAFLRGMTADGQVEMIEQAVEMYPEMGTMFEDLVAAYLDGDLARMQEQATEQLDELPEKLRRHFVKVGIDGRNATMLERSLPLAAEGGVLIAVGALHLPGETGLIQGFRDAGYEVSPVE